MLDANARLLSASPGVTARRGGIDFRRADVRPTGDLVVELEPSVVKRGEVRAYIAPGDGTEDPYDESAKFDMAVSGMSAKQKKDAVAVATSSLGYFACPDGQKGRLQNDPAYAEAKWRMQAKCG